MRRAAIGFLSMLLAGCTTGSGLRFSTDTPPLALVPASAVGAVDLRGEFRARFCAIMADHGAALPHPRPCAAALHELAGEVPPGRAPELPDPRAFAGLRLVVVPGIFGECVADRALPFEDAREHLVEGHGLASMDWIPVSGRSASAANAGTIAAWLREHPTPPGQRLVLLGYSKGASDIIEVLGRFPGAVPTGSAVVGVAPVIAGTPIADRGEDLYAAVSRLPFPGCGPGDGGAVSSLTRRDRLGWLAAKPMPPGVAFYVLPAFARRTSISPVLRPFHDRLSSHDARNDGQVIFQDAVPPGARVLGYADADHWAVALPMLEGFPAAAPLLSRNGYPRAVLLEAVLQTIVDDAR